MYLPNKYIMRSVDYLQKETNLLLSVYDFLYTKHKLVILFALYANKKHNILVICIRFVYGSVTCLKFK